MNNSPPFKRHSVGRTYPWQVAPQQSLLPFRFNNTKFKSVNYIYNLSKFPATFMSNLLPGFSSKKISLPIEILVVAESHGGGRPEGFSGKQKSLPVEVNELENYYRTQPLRKFHQNEIRTLLNHLDDLKVTWVFTDLVKCYVSKSNRQNLKMAADHCAKYLTRQIDVLKPQIIITLGNFVSK